MIHLVEGIDWLDTDFKGVVEKVVKNACEHTMRHGNMPATLLVIGKGIVEQYEVPEGHQEMASFFINTVEEKRDKAEMYIFLTETWSLTLSVENEEEIKKYMLNPHEIADSPNKTERLTFQAASKTDFLAGYTEIHRIGDTLELTDITIDEDIETDAIANVADLLLPMVK